MNIDIESIIGAQAAALRVPFHYKTINLAT